MGWLFGKKKVPQVPLPEGRAIDDKALRFPSSPPKRTIEPKEIKEAVGFDKPVAFPEENGAGMDSSFEPIDESEEEGLASDAYPFESRKEELYVKIDVYQRILGEIDLVKKELTGLNETNKKLGTSEFNEDKNFNRLRKLMKGMHDNLLGIDKVLFKG